MTTLSILMVDDDPVLQDLMRKRLTKAGHTIEVAENGSMAKIFLKKQRYDVVLTDLIMPGDISGIEVLDIAKRKDKSIEVVLITGHSSVNTAVQAMKKGATDYLEKPINFDELLLRLDRIAYVKSIYKSAMDLRLALNKTEGEAAQTIQVLELLNNKLQQSIEDIASALNEKTAAPEDNIARALSIISRT